MQNITVDAVNNTVRDGNVQKPISTNQFNEKNYLNVRLEPKQMSKELKIRLLPIDKDSSTPFKIIHMHTVKVPSEISKSGWKSYVCLNKTEDINHEKFGKKCPFCELANESWKKYKETTEEVTKEQWKKIFRENISSEVCVVRCIERGHEEDGPKFWKFSVRADKKDPFNIIKKLMDTRQQENIDEGLEPGCILDLFNGKDLKVTINAVTKDGKWTNKTSVDIVDYGREKPLSESKEQMEKWVNDEKKWSDVFVAKPYEYLSIIIDGCIPYFDKTTNQWVKRETEANEKEETIPDVFVDEPHEEKPISQEPENTNAIDELPF